ncbi:uncharacterized protein B0H64DRAFT_437512 [Chaetomium fimeti]|uniref:Uncharacterized protein n=1 Tax=Chaetomium fimeti TaxID=1854472 RepID=A0AAE0LWN9_9PEZI|nr:hypothetical protein B0H64DRAFT_437512 [Chaetomium fimeti]
MRIPQPPPPSSLAHKPQLHTRKNHHTYNGTRRLPQSTHVQVITHPTNNTPTSPTGATANPTDIDTPRYIITLHYAHNRACELYRTAYDIELLRRELGVLKHPPMGTNGDGNPGGSSSSSSKTTKGTGGDGNGDTAAAAAGERKRGGEGGCSSSAVCTRSCSCPCPCAEQGCDARDAAGVQSLLGDVLGKMRARDMRGEVPLEWFLKRRIGDCAGR